MVPLRWMRFLHAVLALLLVLPAGALAQPLPDGPSGYAPKEAAVGRHFMVAAANPLAVDAGYAVLARGGTAIDAAIAVQMVLNVVEPEASGIGGGAFILHWSARERRVRAYDGRETAPAAATPDLFLGADGRPMAFFDAVVGGRSVGVPGVLAVLELAHRHHGRLPWRMLFDAAIGYAEQGFPISPRLAVLLERERFLMTDPNARRQFYHADGTPRRAGETLRNPELAATLRAIAAGGARAFYAGEIARDVVAAVRSHPTNPGTLALQDLARYRAIARSPVCGRYREHKVCGMPPPSSGGIAVLQILGILEQFPLGRVAPQSLMAAHLFAEAGRLAYADRDRYVADPDFVAVPAAGMIASQYLARRAEAVRYTQSMGRAAPGVPAAAAHPAEAAAPELPSTSHVSIADASGDAVAMTTTIENAFGSRIMVRGFLLNNQLTDFSFAPAADGRAVANRVEPGKRPRSSMAPTLVFDRTDRLTHVVGSPGGSVIINYVAQALVAMLDWGLDAQQAVDLGHFGSRNGATELERGTAAETLADGLRVLGHDVRVMSMTSGLHAIERVPGGWRGAADARREGRARGG
ncbi:MAG: gamma-glutamyltransferase [Burkholderiales bacterium]|nr:gamma-glutamyltransferase [Burkholderiales bacterium]